VRSRRSILAAIITTTAFLMLVASATAAVKATPYGSTTDPRPGAHGTLTAGVNFDYGSSTSESVKQILIDTPAGGLGNPNAVPFADRCTKRTFESGTCGKQSQIGVVTISATAYTLGFIPTPMNNMTGTISEIQTTPEVPTLVGAYIQPPIGDPIRAYARFYPVTSGPDGDFRIRTETDPFPTSAKALGLSMPIQITKYEQKLFGVLASGAPFITNPTRCDTWLSGGYSTFWKSNAGADSDPFATGTKTWFASKPVPTTPDCAELAPLTATADATIDGPTRGEHAALSTTIEIPGLGGLPLGAAAPKSIAVTLPKGVTIDVAQLGRVCSNEDFAADACPADSRIGGVSITTPSIVDGLTGEAYLVKASPGHNLPDLGIQVHGAIEFSLRGTTRFVNINQVETTFDNNPQLGFSTFKLNLDGGQRGLLQVRKCPAEAGGPTHFEITTYQGQVTSFNSPTSYVAPACVDYAVALKKSKKCVARRNLKITPRIKERHAVSRARLYVAGRYSGQSKRPPFAIKAKLSKRLSPGRSYRYKIKVFFKPDATWPRGHVVTKSSSFRICR
jgi:hypothetical protein